MLREATLRPQPSTSPFGPSHGDAVSRVLGCGRRAVRRAGTGQRPAGGVAGFGTTHGAHHSPSPTVAAWGGFAATCPVTGDTVAGRRARQGRPASRSSSYTHHTQPPAPAVGGAAAGGQTSPFLPVPGRVAVTGGPASGAPTVYGDTLCTTRSNPVPLIVSPFQCKGTARHSIDQGKGGQDMAPKPSLSRQLLELAEDIRAGFLRLARERNECTPVMRNLDDKTLELVRRLSELDQDRLDATYILAQGVLSNWRRYSREVAAIETDGAA